jgi:hypothetical protein
MQTCHFAPTCLDWPTCQPPAFGTHDKILMISRSGRSYDSFFDVFFDITVTDDWHEGPISSLLVIDPNQVSGIEPEPFVESFFDVFVDVMPGPKDGAGVPQETLFVNTQLDDGEVIDHRDMDGDNAVSVGDYLLIEYTNGESVWYRVVMTGTNGQAKSSAAIIDYFELYTEIPPPPPTCACDCHGNPVCDAAICDILDVVSAVNVAFRNFPPILDPNAACPYQTTDVDCNTVTDIVDVVKIVNAAFRNANPATEFCNPCP